MRLLAVLLGISSSGDFGILRVLLVITTPAKDARGRERTDGASSRFRVLSVSISCLQGGDTVTCPTVLWTSWILPVVQPGLS